MHTPLKPTRKILNSSFTPFSSLANSKISTNCDFSREQSNSLSKRRFTRKRQTSNDSQRRLKTFQNEKKFSKVENVQVTENAESPIQKADKLLNKLSFKKDAVFSSKYVKLPTDRSQKNQDTILSFESLNLGSNKGSLTTRIKTEKNEEDFCSVDYRMELEMKNSELMILEDENIRLKKELKSKQLAIKQLEKQKGLAQSQLQDLKRKVNEKVQKLEKALLEKDRLIEEKEAMLEKQDKLIGRQKQQMRKAEKEVQMLKLHAQQLMSKKVSKNGLQIMSYREASLQNQIEELKREVQLSKTEQTKILQNKLDQLKEKLSLVNHDYQTLSIANRVLAKKSQQTELSVEKKHRNELNELRQKMKEMLKETSALKKQNISLRKTLHQSQSKQKATHPLKDGVRRVNRLLTNPKRLDELNKQNSSDSSFSISLSK